MSADGTTGGSPASGPLQTAAGRPRPAARAGSSADQQRLRSAYLELLDQNLDEQTYQSFIETNTRLVPRDFVLNHGIWCDLVFRKLPLGRDYVCDFAFLTKGSMQWRLVLIEIKRPDMRFFRRSTLKLHSQFTDAIEQLSNWRSVLSRDPAGFARGTLSSVMTFPQKDDFVDVRFILVYGRRSEYENDLRRKAKIAKHAPPDVSIMSFDSLVEERAPRGELYLAVRKNEFIDIASDRFIGEEPFVYLAPENLRIGAALFASAKSALERNFNYVEHVDGRPQSVALAALRRVRVRNG